MLGRRSIRRGARSATGAQFMYNRIVIYAYYIDQIVIIRRVYGSGDPAIRALHRAARVWLIPGICMSKK